MEAKGDARGKISPLRSGLRVAVLEVAPLKHLGTTVADDGSATDWPHDAEATLRTMDEVAEVKVVHLQPNARQAIGQIRRLKNDYDVLVNLYDLSDETGSKIPRFCSETGIPFTGSGWHEREIYDPPRNDLKLICRSLSILSPAFAFVEEPDTEDFEALARKLGGFENGNKIFVKPEHGYDSVGVDDKSAVTNVAELKERVTSVCTQFGGALVEQYIAGREFSVMAMGFSGSFTVFNPVEYVFADGKPAQFITFKDKWEDYSAHWRPVDDPADSALRDQLINQSRLLYENFDGNQAIYLGLARFDVRQDANTGKLYFLDINPNPSLYYKHGCTADAIVQGAGWTKADLLRYQLRHAFARAEEHELHHRTYVEWDEVAGSHLHAKRSLAAGELAYTMENDPINFVTREYAQRTFSARDKYYFDHFAWPLGDNVYCTWHNAPGKWKPINHSCDPNTLMQNLDLVARRPIAKDEELTIDYATFIPEPLNFECWCNTPQCRKDANGYLPKNEWRNQWFQDRYGPGEFYSPFIKSLIQRSQAGTSTIAQAQKASLAPESSARLPPSSAAAAGVP